MKKKKKNPAFKIAFFLALIVFLFAATRLGMFFYRYYKEDSSYKELETYAELDETPPPATAEAPQYVSPIDFSSLQELNPDTIAWIYFENMDLSYPVVQGEDDDFYLHHGFYKEENTSGCIFLDTQSAADFSSDNSFVYGHNMKNKSMFAKLNQYTDEAFYRENTTFLVYTPTATKRYEIYSCYPAELDWDSFTYQFDSPEAYALWQTTVKGRSLYDTGVVPDVSQKTVTLMTCTPKGSDYRFLVHGRLIEE